jgi:hypothetical protein
VKCGKKIKKFFEKKCPQARGLLAGILTIETGYGFS